MAICDLIALLCLRLLEPGFSFYNVLCETLTHPQSNIPYDSYVNLVAAGLWDLISILLFFRCCYNACVMFGVSSAVTSLLDFYTQRGKTVQHFPRAVFTWRSLYRWLLAWVKRIWEVAGRSVAINLHNKMIVLASISCHLKFRSHPSSAPFPPNFLPQSLHTCVPYKEVLARFIAECDKQPLWRSKTSAALPKVA